MQVLKMFDRDPLWRVMNRNDLIFNYSLTYFILPVRMSYLTLPFLTFPILIIYIFLTFYINFSVSLN